MSNTVMKLGYAGLLPFVLLSLAVCFLSITEKETLMGELLTSKQIAYGLGLYSFAIIAFLTGTLWGQCLGKKDQSMAMALSNMVFLLALMCFVFLPLTIWLLVAAILLVVIYAFECALLLRYDTLTFRYQHLRRSLTIVASLCLAIPSLIKLMS